MKLKVYQLNAMGRTYFEFIGQRITFINDNWKSEHWKFEDIKELLIWGTIMVFGCDG